MKLSSSTQSLIAALIFISFLTYKGWHSCSCSHNSNANEKIEKPIKTIEEPVKKTYKCPECNGSGISSHADDVLSSQLFGSSCILCGGNGKVNQDGIKIYQITHPNYNPDDEPIPPKYRYVPCEMCNGTGNCQICNGNGYIWYEHTYTGGGYPITPCTYKYCQSGRCTKCNGKGKRRLR